MISVSEQKRKTLSEMAAETCDPWVCPRCAGTDWRTINTYRCKDGMIHRRKSCRNCHHPIMTYEMATKPGSNGS